MPTLSKEISPRDSVPAIASVPGARPATDAPVVVEALGVAKSFRIPTHRIDTFKERAVHPFARNDYRELRALRDVSFEVRKGEFFGIVGRNGSGKSTLLKILASIYQADAGTVRMAGRLAPFIELGVGFDPELAARENIILNGVMMGLTQREAKRRVDAVLEFGELTEFADLKLKNYSSGMSVRLAFSVMVQSDADILLIDEVLAVGDAAFQQKCADVFHGMKADGKTIILVTHDMGAVQTYCHRAMLLHDGEVVQIGDPEEIGRRYLRVNFENGGDDGDKAVPDVHARVVDAWLEDVSGERVKNLEGGEPLRCRIVIEARDALVNPVVGIHLQNADGIHVLGFNHSPTSEEISTIEAAERIHLAFELDNVLTSGHYFLKCMLARDRRPGDMALQMFDLLDFVVYNVEPAPGLIVVDPPVESRIEAATD